MDAAVCWVGGRLSARALLRLGTEEHQPREVFRVDHSNDVLRTTCLVVNRHAGIHMLDDLRAGFFKQHVRRQREDALPRRHDFAHRHVIKLNRPVNQCLLKTGE